MIKKYFFPTLFFLIFILAGCSERLSTDKNNSEPNKKILMVVAPIDFRDAEYFIPKKIFENEGFFVITASIQSGIARGADGGEVKIDLTVSQAEPENYDAVVFVGGPGMGMISSDESLQVLALKFFRAEKLNAAICVAPAVLARAGLLSSREATSHPDAKVTLENNKAIFIDQAVVVGDLIITANGPAASDEFARRIIEKLKQL